MKCTRIRGFWGFHVYSSEWTPELGQKITFSKEEKIPHDGRASSKWKLCPVTAGHVPREMNRHVWYAITEGVDFSDAVKSTKRKVWPLKQGRFEIIIDMEVKLATEKVIVVLKNHVESVSYPVYDDYKDNSSEILKEISMQKKWTTVAKTVILKLINYFIEKIITMRSFFIPGNTFPILKRFQTQNFSPEN